MKNKITGLALIAAMLMCCMFSVNAEDIINERFDDLSVVDAYWTTLTAGQNMLNLTVQDGYLKANTANGNANRTGMITLANKGDKDYMSLSFDFKAGNFNSSYDLKHGLGMRDSKNNEVFNLFFPNHRGANMEPKLNGVILTGVTLPYRAESAWYTVHVLMDFKTHRMGYQITKQGSSEIIFMKESLPMLSDAEDISSIEFYMNRGYNTDFAAIDNITLNEIENPNLPEPPVVENITVCYKNKDNIVKSERIALSNTFEGDRVSYISSNYIQGDDGKYYYVASNYNEDKSNVILNDTAVPVNHSLKASAEQIHTDTVITYDVTEEKDMVFFAEFEDILNTAAEDAPNGRYMASGGKMTETDKTQSFYEIASDGYYQILLVGCPQGLGTGIFPNAETAAAAGVYNDSAAVSFYSAKNDYYGIYSSGTAHLKAGDYLTVRGFGSGGKTDRLDYIAVRKITSGEISGPDGVSILPGNMSVPFTFTSTVNQSPVWSVEGEGISIDNNGVLTVSENAPEGTAVIRAVIGDRLVTGEKSIKIQKPQVAGCEFKGTTSVNIGEQKKYAVENIKDQFGNDITGFVQTSFTSSDACLVIDKEGNAQARSKGSSLLEATITVGDTVVKKEKDVVSDLFYVIAEAKGDETRVDVSGLADRDYIKEYRVTTADAEGNIVKAYTTDVIDKTPLAVEEDAVQILAEYDGDGTLRRVETKNIPSGSAPDIIPGKNIFLWDSLKGMKPVHVTGGMKIDTRGAAKIEISPVYEYAFTANAGNDVIMPDNFADGEYDFTITKSTLQKLDFYVNGYMIGNNINEPGVGRVMSEADKVYSVKDILVDQGTITISKLDCTDMSKAGMDKAVISKAPSIASRKQKVYIIGDSLVSDYYGALQGVVGTGRSGWGQVIHQFMDDTVETVNLANAGQYAAGLLVTAFPGIMHTAQAGDYLIIEAGWNGLKYSNYNEMVESVLRMVDACEARGMHTVLVTPNASNNTWSDKANLRLASAMRDAAATAQERYEDVIFVDLAQISYDYLYGRYGDAVDIIDANFSLGTAGGDKLHLSYLAAMKWAEVVAQGMADAGVEFVDKTFSWSVEDTQGNEIIT